MLTALVLVCSIGASSCDRDTATDVMRVPGEFASPVTCAMHGQAYVADTAIGINLGRDHFVKVVCRPQEALK